MPVPLHPDCRVILELIKASGRAPFINLSPPAARVQYAAGRAVLQPPPPDVASVRDLALPDGVPLRFYRPAGSSDADVLGCLVFAHGGGWVFGDLDTHDHLARSLANISGCAVLSVGYRLAPEHRFPVAVDDCAAALRFAVRGAAALGIDVARIAVGGDSAGGNIAAVLALMARDGAVPPVRFQLLLYPVTEMAQTHPSYAAYTEGLPLTAEGMAWFRVHYVPDAKDWQDWRASPLRAETLAGTAPAFVLTVGHDPLCDEGRAYAARLESEGVPVAHLHAADLLHGALTMAAIIRPALSLITVAGLALRNGLATDLDTQA
ncbi:alpha/beta hydrolase [Plastoroseomonas arctica]|uniref:Alpha/beta hydrolase n=1 Tax=Plastoroseomonas arctica TaxID=1509237 RepID=A0AAF1JWN0_9PROT|nr:alpha/beta hydrolase [Plastoroseomonas arctica]MBR0655372.1 alpha/beta hydrolase [Plastoroseomonas arctica]